jgi:hypothetical protein
MCGLEGMWTQYSGKQSSFKLNIINEAMGTPRS